MLTGKYVGLPSSTQPTVTEFRVGHQFLREGKNKLFVIMNALRPSFRLSRGRGRGFHRLAAPLFVVAEFELLKIMLASRPLYNPHEEIPYWPPVFVRKAKCVFLWTPCVHYCICPEGVVVVFVE